MGGGRQSEADPEGDGDTTGITNGQGGGIGLTWVVKKADLNRR